MAKRIVLIACVILLLCTGFLVAGDGDLPLGSDAYPASKILSMSTKTYMEIFRASMFSTYTYKGIHADSFENFQKKVPSNAEAVVDFKVSAIKLGSNVRGHYSGVALFRK